MHRIYRAAFLLHLIEFGSTRAVTRVTPYRSSLNKLFTGQATLDCAVMCLVCLSTARRRPSFTNTVYGTLTFLRRVALLLPHHPITHYSTILPSIPYVSNSPYFHIPQLSIDFR